MKTVPPRLVQMIQNNFHDHDYQKTCYALQDCMGLEPRNAIATCATGIRINMDIIANWCTLADQTTDEAKRDEFLQYAKDVEAERAALIDEIKAILIKQGFYVSSKGFP